MITFSQRQLKTPRFMRPVYLVTAGQSKFDRAIPGEADRGTLVIDALTRWPARLINKSPRRTQEVHPFLLLRPLSPTISETNSWAKP